MSTEAGSNTSPCVKSSTSQTPSSPVRDGRARGSSGATERLRAASIKFMESSPPAGMWAATGEAAARAPTLGEIRRGSFGSNGWDEEGQRRNSSLSQQNEARRSLSRTISPTSATMEARSPNSPIGSPEPRPIPKGTLSETDSEDDDFPDIIFGRGEMADQSFVSGPTKPKPSAPHLQPDQDPDHESLDSFEPRPKRKSKNLTAMFGESPRASTSTSPPSTETPVPDAEGVYPNGYKFPPKHTWGEATLIGLRAFGKFTFTPLGFFIVIYGLNVVAWGGMLFLLLCNASAPMCYNPYFYAGKDCNNINSPRRIWVEIDSQILNALFCVTGFGLIPWRFRDLYYLLKWRVGKRQDALRRLAGIHRSWFRLPGSNLLPITPVPDSAYDESNPTIPLPIRKAPSPPLTGVRAPPTPLWKLDYVILLFVANTFLQAVLSGFMWGLNRYNRPPWSTGLFVALACTVAAMAGIMQFREGKKIKAVEGVPVEVVEVVRDAERDVAVDEKGKGKTDVVASS